MKTGNGGEGTIRNNKDRTETRAGDKETRSGNGRKETRNLKRKRKQVDEGTKRETNEGQEIRREEGTDPVSIRLLITCDHFTTDNYESKP